MLEGGGEVLKEGVLHKRSGGWLQRWKQRHCVLTAEGLVLHRAGSPPLPLRAGRAKQLHFGDMKTVDGVERKGKYVYFTVVMVDRRELDFRCPQDAGWNALITLGMVRYQNRRAMEAVRCSRQKLAQRGIGLGVHSAA
ncbi:pleckstrin homology-like domain family A member 1 [Narcine bancroftii]|uniref:pleckstrin homology-like domain family A member 1 n=1 Tax=Narcine bancroftii TaxID=1343680 RepID=UPI003831EFF0